MGEARVVLVEDSPTTRVYLSDLLEEAGFSVVGSASRVKEAEVLIQKLNPDLLVSDIRLPDGNGIDLTRRIMQLCPLPIVLMTAYDPGSPELIWKALQAGALEVLPKPPARNDPSFPEYFDQFVRALKPLIGLPMVRRRPALQIPEIKKIEIKSSMPDSEPPVIAIGASTGGPTIVAELMQSLEAHSFQFGVIAQHMVPDFLENFRLWLQNSVPFPVKMAEVSHAPEKGAFYVVPPKRHLLLSKDQKWNLHSPEYVASVHVPSIDTLFRSLADVIPKKVIAVLLTGMGKDGAAGLKALKDAGAFTIVQDPRTAVLPSMPEAAIEMNAASIVLTPEQIVSWLRDASWRNHLPKGRVMSNE